MKLFLACALFLMNLGAACAQFAPTAEIEPVFRQVVGRADEIHPQQRGLSPERVQELFQKTSRHPVATLTRVAVYDPDNYVGFCFGRAMTAHLIARKMGVHPAAVKKLFICGDMRTATADKTQWRFHVTTIVKAQGSSEWYAIDPIMYRVMKAREWIDHVRRTWDIPRKAHFYVVSSDVVIPDVTRVPPVAEETGERIIELSFRPEGKPGFKARADLGHNCFEANLEAARKYFICTQEPEAPFDFAGIAINGKAVTYRNYFRDLMAALAGPDPVVLPGVSNYVAERRAPSQNAGSMDFERLLSR